MRLFASFVLRAGHGHQLSGLTINGRRAGGELPPRVVDPAYNAFLVEQQVRRTDAERVIAPKAANHSAAEIKRGLIDTPDERDWREGLTTPDGRKTSVRRSRRPTPTQR